tara:strand:+ start:39 stop:1673 length:1635 start_codon:yes stop_codon:yes gene_type:complete
MLKVSNSLPISNFSQVVVSDNSGSTFKPKTNSRVRVVLPANLGMIDFHNSYLQCKFLLKPHTDYGNTNTYKMGFSNDQGIEQVVRDLVVRVDGKPVETITNYNILDKVRKDFSMDTTMKNIHALFDHGTMKGDNPSYFCKTWNNITATADFSVNEIATKQQFHPELSGILSSPQAFPIIASGNVEVEINLEDAENVLECKHYLGDNALNKIFIGSATGALSADADGGIDSLKLAKTIANFKDFGWNGNDCPVVAGNVIKLSGFLANGDAFNKYATLDAITKTDTNTTLSADVSAFFVATTFVNDEALTGVHMVLLPYVNPAVSATAVPTTLTTELYTYEITDVEYVCRTIEMPPPYLQAIQKRIQGEGMIIDVPTYSMYLDNIQANINRQSLLVPCYSSRVKGVISVPVNSVQETYRYDRNGKVDDLREFQIKIGSRVEPQRPVDLTNWTTNTTNQYHSQEYINEMTNALVSVGIGQRSLLKWRDNFFLGRSLSVLGGSEDLSDKGIRWEISHNANTNTAKNVYSFVNMVRRLQIVPSGIMIYG